MINLNPGERIDDLQRNGYSLIQNSKQFCFGVDAVLLSSFAEVKDGDRVCDLCTGNGVIPILLEAKTNGREFVGVEIQESVADMGKRSVLLNKLENKVSINQGDIKEAPQVYGRASFDVVTCNPPYMDDNHGLKNPDMPKAIARHEIYCNLRDVISVATALLKPQGRFYMIHRPHRLVDIMALMREYKLEPKRLRLIYPYVDKEPTMILIEGVRGGNTWLKCEPPLVIYEEKNVYTKEVKEVYGKE